jgi:hypothetical protein
MRPALKTIASVLASAALAASSTATADAAPAAQAQAQAPNAWMALSMLSPTRSVALAGANATAQPVYQPPPPEYTGGPVIGAEVIALGLWAVLIVAALTINGKSGGSEATTTPISPG